jgi:hypothetical protein
VWRNPGRTCKCSEGDNKNSLKVKGRHHKNLGGVEGCMLGKEKGRGGFVCFKAFLNLWAGKDFGASRVIDSYSAHALKLALRYFNHLHEV